MKYKVKARTRAFNKPGLSPTEKNGTDMGWVETGSIFETNVMQNGWLALASNKWVMKSACEPVSTTPPLSEISDVMQIRFGQRVDGEETWEPWTEWMR